MAEPERLSPLWLASFGGFCLCPRRVDRGARKGNEVKVGVDVKGKVRAGWRGGPLCESSTAQACRRLLIHQRASERATPPPTPPPEPWPELLVGKIGGGSWSAGG